MKKYRVSRFLTTDPYNRRGQIGKKTNEKDGVITLEFSDGKTGIYDANVLEKHDKMKRIPTISLELPFGDVLIGCNGKYENRSFYVKFSTGRITEYDESEMAEVYGVVPTNTEDVGCVA